jgi:hypothetical protein
MKSRNLALLPVALVTSAVLVGGCTSTDTGDTADTTTTPSSDAPTTAASDEPIDLTQVDVAAPLERGRYAMPFLAVDSPMRAIVNVPEGYFAWPGGRVIDSGDGDAAFWGRVTKGDTDPCLGGKKVGVGTSVRDLAAALVAQRHMSTSRPVPVTVGGYHGLYVKTVAPSILDRCQHKNILLSTAGGTWLQSGEHHDRSGPCLSCLPGATFRIWILNVRGQRVVAGTRTYPHTADPDGLVGVIESAEFTSVDEP